VNSWELANFSSAWAFPTECSTSPSLETTIYW